jgi:hypothetical protein
MSNKKVNLRVATMATHQSAKVPSLQLATYGWLSIFLSLLEGSHDWD